MSTPNPILQAAAPVLISAIQAIQQFETDLGPATQWAMNLPGARLKLLGSLALLLPTLEIAEGGAVETVFNTVTAGWVTKLQAMAVAPKVPAKT